MMIMPRNVPMHHHVEWVDVSEFGGSQLEEGEIDKPRENRYNRCVKAEARTWKK